MPTADFNNSYGWIKADNSKVISYGGLGLD
jgi:hypothetical protein